MRYALGKIILLFTISVGLILIHKGYQFEYFEWVTLFPSGFDFRNESHWLHLFAACLKPTYAILGTLILVANWKCFHVPTRTHEGAAETVE
jgi:hypothetical protein